MYLLPLNLPGDMGTLRRAQERPGLKPPGKQALRRAG